MSHTERDTELSEQTCWERLHANTLGRLVIADGNTVEVLPVLYGISEKEIYVRTTRGERFSSVVVSRHVAFEIDELLFDGVRSVIVQGIAHWLPPEMTPRLVEKFDNRTTDSHTQWVQIIPRSIKGREYSLIPAQH